MNKLTTRLLIAVAVLVVGTVAASAQTMTAAIPFEFRVGNRVMAPGTYDVDRLHPHAATTIFRLMDTRLRRSAIVLPRTQVDPQKGWAGGEAKLVFACISGRCVLDQLWSGSERYAYQFASPKLGNGEEAYLRVIPMQRDKGE